MPLYARDWWPAQAFRSASTAARSADLTDALAFSNNYYFANLGIKLGYERVNYYAHLFGYGEKAGINIDGEHPGYFPPAPPKNGGMGMLTSFGEEILRKRAAGTSQAWFPQ